jgi:hypothetical protein
MAKKNQHAAGSGSNPTEALIGTDKLPADVELSEGVTVPLGDIVRRAFEDSALDVPSWNALSAEARDAAIMAARAEMADEPEDGEDPDVEDDEEEVEDADLVECAVLHDNVYGKHDDIIELSADHAEAAEAAGYVDTHPNAIKAIREAAEATKGAQEAV